MTTALPDFARKIADKMYPQTSKNEYSQWEVEKLLIAVCDEARLQRDRELLKMIEGLQQYDMESWPDEDSWITPQEKGDYIRLDDVQKLLGEEKNNET